MSLIKDGVGASDGIWADFGSGRGAFTLALADLLSPRAQIYSIDKDTHALDAQEKAFKNHFANRLHPTLRFIGQDYTNELELPVLDGALMANSLHFHKHKAPIVEMLQHYLRPEGVFILVEYNVDRGNHWVPYPLSYTTWEKLSLRLGFRSTTLLARRKSSFLKEFYSAMSVR